MSTGTDQMVETLSECSTETGSEISNLTICKKCRTSEAVLTLRTKGKYVFTTIQFHIFQKEKPHFYDRCEKSILLKSFVKICLKNLMLFETGLN